MRALLVFIFFLGYCLFTLWYASCIHARPIWCGFDGKQQSGLTPSNPIIGYLTISRRLHALILYREGGKQYYYLCSHVTRSSNAYTRRLIELKERNGFCIIRGAHSSSSQPNCRESHCPTPPLQSLSPYSRSPGTQTLLVIRLVDRQTVALVNSSHDIKSYTI